jgi:hypothetical protein
VLEYPSHISWLREKLNSIKYGLTWDKWNTFGTSLIELILKPFILNPFRFKAV